MGYNPNTGITTYSDPTVLDTSAGQPALSTATSLPPAMTAANSAPAAPAMPASHQYAMGYLDYNSLPEYMRYRSANPDEFPEGFDRNSPNPFVKVWGQQIGLDNNYNYGIMPDGSVQQLFYGFDPYYSPDAPTEFGYDPSINGTVKTAQQLADEYGWDYANAPRDAHGYAQPGSLGGLTFAPYTNPGVHSNFFWDQLMPQLVFTALTYGVGSAASAGTAAAESGAAADGLEGLDASTGAFAGESANAGTGTYGTYGGGATGADAGMLSGLGRQFASNLLQSGGDLKGAAKNTVVGAGLGVGANLAASGINSGLNSIFAPTNAPSRFGQDVFNADLEDQSLGDTMKRRMPFDADLNDSFLGSTMNARPGMLSPLQAELQGAQRASTVPGTEMNPVTGGIEASRALSGAGMLPVDSATALTAAAPAPTTDPSDPSQAAPQVTPEQVKNVVKGAVELGKYGRALSQLNGGRGQPEDAPQREDGESDEQYAQSLTDYAQQVAPDAGLDAQTLADKGLTPGTPEYYSYIMDRMDEVIARVTDGLDPDDANLSDKLRTKTRAELDQLERALYVRGQLGSLMGSGKYTDPFTGNSEDVIAPEGGMLNPAKGAYHRGLARSVDEMSRMSPGEARRYAGGMLGRNVDLFGMQERADQRTEDEALAEQGIDVDRKRRRGMLSGR